MPRESSKVRIEDDKYNAIFKSYHVNEITKKSTIRYRKLRRITIKLNAARYECRRTGNFDMLRDAEVAALMAVIQ